MSCICNCTQPHLSSTLQKPVHIADQGFPNHCDVSILNLEHSEWFLGDQEKHSDFQEVIIIKRN